MSYYPKSQITTNLYTSGGEFIKATDGLDYIGFYFKNSQNEFFTGKTPTNKPNLRLLKVTDPQTLINSQGDNEEESLESTTASWQVLTKYSKQGPPGNIPKKFTTLPTQKDYELGEFQRYFTKKRTQNYYFEISQEDYKLLNTNDPKLQFQLYLPIILSWRLKGTKSEVYNTNKNTVKLLEQNIPLPGFSQFFKDKFDKYYKFELQENLQTDGTEYKNKITGQPYKGLYHTLPEKGPMVGATHIDSSHDYLIPIDEKSVEDKPQTLVTGSQQPTITYARPTTNYARPTTVRRSSGGSGGGYRGGGGGGY